MSKTVGARELKTRLGRYLSLVKQGETLVVTTTNLGWPYSFGQIGIPQSEEVELTERFTVVDDGGRLEYEITSSDPATFSEPLTLTKSFLWVPGLELLPYECSEA